MVDGAPKVMSLSSSSLPTGVRYLSLQQLLLLNAVVCGLEFCASAAFTYIPPMLLKAGIEEAHMSVILGVGPLLGFFLVPVIGRASDRCSSRYGRRRPFILGLGLLLIFSLIVIPYGELFGIYTLGGQTSTTKRLGLLLLVVGAVLLDFTSQACLTPCEALLSDACRNSSQQERCFTVYSFMISVGGCIGYLITALDWNSSVVGLYFGGQEQSAFSVLIVLFSFTLCSTLLVADEIPLVDAGAVVVAVAGDPRGAAGAGAAAAALGAASSPAAPHQESSIHQKLDEIHQAIVRHKEVHIREAGGGGGGGGGGGLVCAQDPGYESGSNHSVNDEYQAQLNYHPERTASLLLHPSAEKPPELSRWGRCVSRLWPCWRQQCDIPGTRWSFTTYSGLVRLLLLRLHALLPQTVKSLFEVPFVLRRLALANFCSWTAVMGFNLFYTDFVGQAVYSGNPNAPEDSPERALYDEGVRMGSWGLLFHCVTSALYAIVIERMVQRYGLRMVYFLGMFTFTLAMAAMMFVRSLLLINLMAACTGLAYATLTTIPFMLVTQYHENKETFFCDVQPSDIMDGADGSPPRRGIATDMATLDSAYFLSQVLLSLLMGYIVMITGTVLAYVVCACGLGAVACACSVRIIFSKQQMSAQVRGEKCSPAFSAA